MNREHKYKAYINNPIHGTGIFKVKSINFNPLVVTVIIPNGKYIDNIELTDEVQFFEGEVILLEYVGFRDNKGIEIYEGYIDQYGHVVTYLADLNSGLGMEAGWYLQRDNFESWSKLECDKYIEIIGNIFENPEKAINNCHTDYTTLF